MRLAAIGALGIVVCVGSAYAKPRAKTPALKKVATARVEKAATSWFLAADPHVPLAVVRGGRVEPAVPRGEHGKSCGPKSRWAVEGSKWFALDAWGNKKGLATVEVAEPYDVTKCSELYFAPKFDKHTEATLFVSADSAYVPGPSAEWHPPAHARWTFQASLLQLPSNGKRKLPFQCSEVPKPIRYFSIGGTKLAVGGTDGAIRIAAYDGQGWTPEYSDHGVSEVPICYRPVAILDLDGDGRPELVVRKAFNDGDGWGDSVLGRDDRGHWTELAISPGGSTA